MWIYDSSQYDPPAPVATVTLRSLSGTDVISDVRLLLDTGADVTLLPKFAVERVGVTVESRTQYELMGFDGARSSASTAILEVVFLNRVFKGQFLLIDQETGILGRDILNHLILVLDGPKTGWSEGSP